MGTRSLTRVFERDQKKPLMVLYRQFDGYPEGHGQELLEFLHDKKQINGFSSDKKENKHSFNGMGDLAVRLICYLKECQGKESFMTQKDDGSVSKYDFVASDQIGNFYLHPITLDIDSDIEYVYDIVPTSEGPLLIAQEVKDNGYLKEISLKREKE